MFDYIRMNSFLTEDPSKGVNGKPQNRKYILIDAKDVEFQNRNWSLGVGVSVKKILKY